MPWSLPAVQWWAHPVRLVHLVHLLAAASVLLGLGSAWAGPRPVLPASVPASERQRLQQVTEGATVAARVAAPSFRSRRDVFEFLLDHPEFATHVTRALRLARYRIWRASDGLWIDDGWGARGRFEVVHAASGLRVIHARGSYEQALFPSIDGEAVVVIEYASSSAAHIPGDMTTTISGFVKIENPLLAAAGRMASAVAAAKAQREGRRLAKVFARTSRAIEEDPAAVYERLRQRPDVPGHDLEQFRRLVNLPRTPPP